ncbi:phosphoribosylanthranilate isomerase [Phreatobacter sp.]|uniref:phosphoribosylanthranilate isomerase n=1 Tax=Phreatobacter sp. TaxID=1966341 RepID=UPI003F701D0C
MSLIVKICGLRSAAAMDAALQAGADMVGLVFYPRSPRNVQVPEAVALAARARDRAAVVTLTVDADDVILGTIIGAVKPDILQLHGSESPERLAEIRARFGVKVMKAVGIGEPADLSDLSHYASVSDYLLVDAKPPKTPEALPGGNGLAFDWRLVAGLDPGVPVVLSGGLTPETVAEAVRLTRLQGVDVSSGVETAPGIKDPGKIRAFVAAARRAAGEGDRR